MTKKEVIKLWKIGSEDAWNTAEILYSHKKYDHSLFFAQLSLEKLIKSLTYHITGDHPIFTHDLEKLGKKIKLKLSDEQYLDLKEISSFNVSGRYKEDKSKLYHKATSAFTKIWFQKSKDFIKLFNSFF